MNETKVDRVGRFDYVEPMNLNLDLPDNAITHKPEDYCISVNLTVEVPSRFYKENNDTILVASSDNGSISFFGGSDFGGPISGESKDMSRGYLSTSWTDISVNNVGKGNRECLGIESINVAYSPNFFPMVTIRFVDVRGASLFMPQEESYRNWVNDNSYDPKRPFDGNSFFKSLFSMPSPIFKLTIKGFYGKQVTYKLLMSKFDSEFDSETGNFIANVQFAGYMYGVYTELPMSFIALSPYLDGLKYWEKKHFTLDNGIEIPTIPNLIKKIGKAAEQAPQESLQSEKGREFTETQALLTKLKEIKNNFPFKGFVKSEGEFGSESKRGIKFAEENYSNSKKNFTDVDELKTRSRIVTRQSKQVYYKIEVEDNISLFNSNRVTYPSNSSGFDSKLRKIKKGSIENYKEQLKELVDKHGKEYQRYVDDFDSLLNILNYQKNIYENGELTQVANPVMCVLCKGGSGEKQVRGVDLVNKDKEKKTYGVSYLGFKIGEGARCNDCRPEDVEVICKKINGEDFTYKSSVFVSKIITNILVWAEDEIKKFEKIYEKLESEVREEQSEIAERLIGFPLTIKNFYDIIFAHIDTFMFRFYGHLNNIANDTVRKNLINRNFYSLLDVPDSFKDKEIPPFPTFVSKTEKDGEKITWPCVILNDDIEETKFVYEIINAALQLGNDIKATLKELGNKSNANAVNYPTGCDKRIPVTIFDFLYDGNVNPYVAVYERYKKNPSINVKKEIWFTFIMRCAYFGEIFAKYRTLYTTDSKSYGVSKKAQEDIFNGAHEYFAAAEACNIKKAFGNNLDMPVIVDMINKTANSAFKSELSSYISGTETTQFNNTSENWGKWNIKFEEDFEVDDKHFAIPIANIQPGSIRTDIGNNNTCVDKNDEYVVFRKDGKNTIEALGGKILNEKSIQIIEVDDFFSKWVNLIKGDYIFLESKALENSQINTFLDDFLNNYLGKYMYGGADEKAGDSFDNPYRIGDNEKIFVEKFNGEKFSYLDIAKLSAQESGVYCLQYSINSLTPKNYTSFINGLPCIDPVNVISNGSMSGDSAVHFPFQSEVKLDRFLNDSATQYDKAYLFLFSLPIKKIYFSTNTYGLIGKNLYKVANSCLLREGAFYYWQENWQTIKTHFYENYGATMTENSIPIIKTEEKNPVPTLFMKNDKEQEYMILELENIPLNRKKFLIDYFKRWVETDFKTDIANIQMNINGLTDIEMQRVMRLYLHSVVYVDYSQPLVRDLYVGSGFDKKTVKFEAENVKFFTSIYDKFRNYLSTLYPQSVTTKADVVNLQDTERGIKSSIDLKLSVYLTLQSLYNKFIAGNKHDRWKYQGKESDFNNFIYMDSFYNLIGQKLIFNSTRIQNMLSDVTDSVNALTNSDTNMYKGSVYEFFSTICQENGLNLLALPVKPFVTEDSNGSVAWHLFDNIPYSQMESGESSCFISMYTYRPSEHLDNSDSNGLYAFKNDGFDINLNGEKDLPIPLQDFGEYDNAPRIPAFAVSYGKQNQSIFKKITVSTANPQITEPSIAMTFNIAAKGDSNPRDSVFFGQDIYSVYSNYSYTCDVEMMGCAPIMPLMYFQLNNIPMFKGAYMIINVEHNVVAGNMTTRFKGVRVNKAAIPFVKVPYVYTDDLGNRIVNDDGEYSEDRTGKNFYPTEENPPIVDFTNSTSWEERMRVAFNMAFNCEHKTSGGETKGMCGRYTYRMAYAFITGEDPCNKFPNKNARDMEMDKYDFGGRGKFYTMECQKTFLTANECKDFINSQKYNVGDVVIYWTNTPVRNSENKLASCYLYGHAQIYTGTEHSSTVSNGVSRWASSVKNNYGTSMVYANTYKSTPSWTVRIYRQLLSPVE